MARTYKNLQDEVLAWLDEGGATGTSLTIVKNALKQAHEFRCASEAWTWLRWDTPETFTIVPGQRLYSLHQEFWRPLYFFNRDTGKYLVEVPARSVPGTGADWTRDTDRAEYFRFAGRTAVKTQPSSASVVTIVSSAADTGASKQVTVRGVTTSNDVYSETLTPNSTTPVVGTVQFTKILGVTKAAAWTGTMTMTSNSAAVTNLVLYPAELSRSYRQLELLSAPEVADTIEYKFLRLPSPLSADNDLTDFPPPLEGVLVWDTLLLMAGYLTDISAKSIEVWRDQQARMEDALRQVEEEGQSAEALPQYVRDMGDEFPLTPRVWRD